MQPCSRTRAADGRWDAVGGAAAWAHPMGLLRRPTTSEIIELVPRVASGTRFSSRRSLPGRVGLVCRVEAAVHPLRVMPAHPRPVQSRSRGPAAVDATLRPTTPAGRQRTDWPRAGRAKRRQLMATEQPNVLLVMADDIGWFDVGAYHRGIMGARDAQHRPDRRRGRAVDRQLRPGQLHGRAGGVHHRADPDADRADHGGLARGRPGPPARGPDPGRAAQAPGVHDRPARQEPPGRPQRVPPHRARL